ncbi:hypothetical protein HRU45_01780 [Candidatus Dependentiae bacterium]|nr:hypothetical protein [Candidatus Dependentiae bacterium]
MKKYKYMHLFLLLSASATSLILQGDFAKIFEKIDKKMHKTYQAVQKMTHTAFDGWFDQKDDTTEQREQIVMKESPEKERLNIIISGITQAPDPNKETWNINSRAGFSRLNVPLHNGQIRLTINTHRQIASIEFSQEKKEELADKTSIRRSVAQSASGFSRSMINKPTTKKPTVIYDSGTQTVTISVHTKQRDHKRPDPFAKTLHYQNGTQE